MINLGYAFPSSSTRCLAPKPPSNLQFTGSTQDLFRMGWESGSDAAPRLPTLFRLSGAPNQRWIVLASIFSGIFQVDIHYSTL